MTVISKSGQQGDHEPAPPNQSGLNTADVVLGIGENPIDIPSTSTIPAVTVNTTTTTTSPTTSSSSSEKPPLSGHPTISQCPNPVSPTLTTPSIKLNPNISSPVHQQQPVQQENNSSSPNDGCETDVVDSPESLVDPTTGEVKYLLKELHTLDDMVNRSRWIVPVLANGELELLIKYSTRLAKAGIDQQCEQCQRFYREGLTISFQKILFDEAVSGWKPEIQQCIYKNSMYLLELCYTKLLDDCFPLLELLYMVLSPISKFQQHSLGRSQDFKDASSTSQVLPAEIYGDFRETRNYLALLVDFINYFGRLGGYDRMLERFQKDVSTLSVAVIHAHLKPFGVCHEYLLRSTIERYFAPVVRIVMEFLQKLSDEDLKKESKTESKNDSLSGIIRCLQSFLRRMPGEEDAIRDMEMLRLKLILRVLQVAPFNGKMNALIELNKMILPLHTIYTPRNYREQDTDTLSASQVAKWIQENEVLSIILRENLHQPQYVEKLEKIVRFMIKEETLTQSELDRIWDAQEGKHEAIVKNIHDLMAKLAWDFTPDQLDHLFKCFQTSWTCANRKQRERLIELIRRLAEEDKDGVMAQKVLGLLWEMAIGEDCPLEIMELALSAHVKILDFSCTQDRDAQKMDWVHRLLNILKAGDQPRYMIPAMRQIMDICSLFAVAPQNYSHYNGSRVQHNIYRNDVVTNLQREHFIIDLVATNLGHYMDAAKQFKMANPDASDPKTVYLDGRFNHSQHVSERLRFIRYLLREGMLYLFLPQAVLVWQCLAEQAVYSEDRDACFRWFVKLMHEEQDLEPECTRKFFEEHVMRVEPTLLTQNGMTCFELFFRHVNAKENRMQITRHGYVLEDINLIGSEYLWRIVLNAGEEVALKAVTLLRALYTNLGSRLIPQQREINEDLIQNCRDRLKAACDTVSCLGGQSDSKPLIEQELLRMIRVITVLKEFIVECDDSYTAERTHPPLCRSWRGRTFSVLVRFSGQNGRSGFDEHEVMTHTNETIGRLRGKILRQKLRDPSATMLQHRLELYYNNTLIDPYDDHRLLSHFNIKENMTPRAILSGKLTNLTAPQPVSSPDSSSDSSHNTSPRHRRRCRSGGVGGTVAAGNLPGNGEMVTSQAEFNLPGVMMSMDPEGSNTAFLFRIADTANQQKCPRLRDGVHEVLSIMPSDDVIMKRLKKAVKGPREANEDPLSQLLFGKGPTETMYAFQVLYQLMLPATTYDDREDCNSVEFTYWFLRNGGVNALLDVLSRNDFLIEADLSTRKQALLWLLRLLRLSLSCVAFSYANVVDELESAGQNTKEQSKLFLVLEAVLKFLPSPSQDCYLRECCFQLGTYMRKRCPISELQKILPDGVIVKAIMKMTWSASSANLRMMYSTTDDIHKALERSLPPLHNPLPTSLSLPAVVSSASVQLRSSATASLLEKEDEELAKEALECLTLCLALCPSAVEKLSKDKAWHQFVIDMVLLVRSTTIRSTAQEQFFYIATRCSIDSHPLMFFIQLLFTVLNTQVPEYSIQSSDYFCLLERLLEHTRRNKEKLANGDVLLRNEINWLKKLRADMLTSGGGVSGHISGSTEGEQSLLQGHLKLCKELLVFQSPENKYTIGSKDSGQNMIQELIEDFIFPASKQVLQMRENKEAVEVMEQAVSICNSVKSQGAAFELLVSLVSCCPRNMTALACRLIQMYYADPSSCLTEWEYLPPVGPRPNDGFVGLKNAGATCYMNSILQQLFMISPIRDAILSANTGDDDYNEEEDSLSEAHSRRDANYPASSTSGSLADAASLPGEANDSSRPNATIVVTKDNHNVAVLRHVQAIFGHLAYSKLQYYVPRGFWRQFKLWGDSVNLREQHDALEFFNCLVDNLDEALKTLTLPKVVEQVMGGSFADQKICIDCPHRYSREEPFTTLNVDIRNHQNLLESLEQYVKGDLLEGDNAYLCENCAKKVDTVKRLCIKRLPLVLAIQLKRFDYDWERDTAIKFNDYFEFPREIDMEPYTAAGLARAEDLMTASPGEEVPAPAPSSEGEEEVAAATCTKFVLKGVVVHSGQASGGHYYSYIRHYRRSDDAYYWFKYDDNEVSECKMEDNDEMRNQWFGGEFMGEVYDQMMKRMSYRKQKRWWNAYILFYEREDFRESSILSDLKLSFDQLTLDDVGPVPIPKTIERLVQRQNIEYTHNKAQYSHEYFHFMKRLADCHFRELATVPMDHHQLEKVSITTLDLLIKFLFSVGFRTKKVLRGSATEWLEAIKLLLDVSRENRMYFAKHVFFDSPSRLAEYLLECPSPEIRHCFSQLVVFIAHRSRQDAASVGSELDYARRYLSPIVEASLLADNNLGHFILLAVLVLIRKEVLEYARHFTQFFRLFIDYLHCGREERVHLLRLGVPAMFIAFALEETPGQPVKYGDLGKLVSTVSLLTRSCDVSHYCQINGASGVAHNLANPYRFGVEVTGAACYSPNSSASSGMMMSTGVSSPQSVEQFDPLMPIPNDMARYIYEQPSRFVKKMLDDTLNMNTYTDITYLIKFCCYENRRYSMVVLDELVWMLTYSYSTELRLYLDLTYEILCIEDSWQSQRILDILRGHDEIDALIETLLRVKNHQQKRSYQILKMLVRLFDANGAAAQLLQTEEDIAKKFRQAVEWLGDELDRRVGVQWANTHIPSNEVSNSYFVERSNSAINVHKKGDIIVQNMEIDTDDNTTGEVINDNENANPPVQMHHMTAPAKGGVEGNTPAPSSSPSQLPGQQPPPSSGTSQMGNNVVEVDVESSSNEDKPPPYEMSNSSYPL